MCYFITIGSDIPFECLKSCEEGSLYIKKANNPFFKVNMHKAISYGHLTDGHCSCSLVTWETEEDINNIEIKLRKKYKKKGYSENKAEKVINEMKSDGKLSYGKTMQQILKRIFAKSENIYIYCHMYSGSIEDEKPPLKKQKAVSSDCFDNNIEEWLPEDTIVFIPKQLDWKTFTR